VTRIAVIAEIHMRDEYASELQRELSWVVDRLDGSFEPDHVVILGDVIEHGETAAADQRNFERVREVVESASAPVTYLLGNHDRVNLTRGELSDLLGQEAFYGCIDGLDVPLVYLDSSRVEPTGARGELGFDQLRAVRRLLSDADDAVVFVHHPVGDFDVSDNPWFCEFPELATLGDRKSFFDIVAETDAVRATVSGHIHTSAVTTFQRVPHCSVNAFSKERPDIPLTGSYAELTIGDAIDVDVKVRDETVASFRIAEKEPS